MTLDLDPNEAAMATLADHLGVIPRRDRGFAASLVSGYRRNGRLSDKQWHWVRELARRIEGTPERKRRHAPNGGEPAADEDQTLIRPDGSVIRVRTWYHGAPPETRAAVPWD